MGFFGSGDKIQTSTDTQTGASDQGQAVTASGSNVAAGQGRNIGSGSVGAQDDGTVISGSAVASQGLVNSNNSGTISYGLGAQDVTKLLSDTTTKIGDLVNNQTEASTNQLSSALASLGDLALSKQTDGESARDKTVLWIVFLVLAAVVALYWKRKG